VGPLQPGTERLPAPAAQAAAGAEAGAVAINARTWQQYQAGVNQLYGGEAAFSRREFVSIVDGVRQSRIADNVVELGGNLVAVESKFTGGWASSPFNPASSVGRLPFAARIQADMLAQARSYSQAFSQVIYHSNSPELIAHYTRVFQEAGITNFRFILTP
jgi:hypothetical protein